MGDSFWSVPCFGDETGAIDIEVIEGAEPIDYVWTNSNGDIISTDEDLENIGADIYTILVTDANGNTITQSVNVDQPPSLINISLTNPIVNVLPCFGDETGQINIDVDDGLEKTQIRSFEWTDTNNNIVSSEQNLVNFGAGIYTVIATDPNAAGTETYEILEPEEIIEVQEISDYSGFEVSGADQSDGFINISVNGGSGNYSYIYGQMEK